MTKPDITITMKFDETIFFIMCLNPTMYVNIVGSMA